MGFSRQKYWCGLPCPLPGDLPDPGIGSTSLTSPALAVGSLPLVPPGKPALAPCAVLSSSVLSDSLWPHELQSARLVCPWGFSGKDTGVDGHSLLQGIFRTQGSNPGLLHCRCFFTDWDTREATWLQIFAPGQAQSSSTFLNMEECCSAFWTSYFCSLWFMCLECYSSFEGQWHCLLARNDACPCHVCDGYIWMDL